MAGAAARRMARYVRDAAYVALQDSRFLAMRAARRTSSPYLHNSGFRRGPGVPRSLSPNRLRIALGGRTGTCSGSTSDNRMLHRKVKKKFGKEKGAIQAPTYSGTSIAPIAISSPPITLWLTPTTRQGTPGLQKAVSCRSRVLDSARASHSHLT